MSFLLDSDITEICSNIKDLTSAFEGKTILITGASGFLGKYFTSVFIKLNETALNTPCKIVALDNFITSNKNEFPPNANLSFLQYDVTKPFEPEQKIDFVLAAAGIASPEQYQSFPLQTMECVTLGLKHALELAKQNHAKLLFFSSSEIYGDPDPKFVPTKEDYKGFVSCTGPRACYDESKRLGETMISVYHKTYGVSANMCRPFNVFGPGMLQKDYRVLPNFMSKILSNESISIYGNGNQTRTFCYVTDAIEGFLRVLVKGKAGQPYNIGNPTPELSMIELANTLETVLGQKNKREIINHPACYPADEPNRRCPDITKARKELDYSPKVSLEDGLKRFYNWAKENYTY
jgi:UDP-glucuronate decarboxylase